MGLFFLGINYGGLFPVGLFLDLLGGGGGAVGVAGDHDVYTAEWGGGLHTEGVDVGHAFHSFACHHIVNATHFHFHFLAKCADGLVVNGTDSILRVITCRIAVAWLYGCSDKVAIAIYFVALEFEHRHGEVVECEVVDKERKRLLATWRNAVDSEILRSFRQTETVFGPRFGKLDVVATAHLHEVCRVGVGG